MAQERKKDDWDRLAETNIPDPEVERQVDEIFRKNEERMAQLRDEEDGRRNQK